MQSNFANIEMDKCYNMGLNLEQKTRLVNELTQGRELARQLHILLNATSTMNPSANSQTVIAREVLIQKIISSYEKVLSMLTSSTSSPSIAVEVVQDHHQQQQPMFTIRMANSPPSLNGSPRSEDSDNHIDASRKRKGVARWSKRVRVTSGMGLEGPLDDGYSWRKYGQKDILGAKYPRGYYRCTNRNVQGCLATKQVQRSDEDPMILEITYRGRHTCTQAAATTTTTTTTVTSPPPETILSPLTEPNQQPRHHDTLLSLPEALRVITESLDTSHDHQDQLVFSSFNNNNVRNFTSSLTMPATSTSGADYFSIMCQQDFGGSRNLHRSIAAESHEIISAATSATSSPTLGLDFPFAQADHEMLYSNFNFNDHDFSPKLF